MHLYAFTKGVPGKEIAPFTVAKQEGPRPSFPKGLAGGPKVQKGRESCLGGAAEQASCRARKEAWSPAQPRALSASHLALFSSLAVQWVLSGHCVLPPKPSLTPSHY